MVVKALLLALHDKDKSFFVNSGTMRYLMLVTSSLAKGDHEVPDVGDQLPG